jgi:D-lactate dehydrogenase
VREGAAAVYLPACINRIFGNACGSEHELSLPDALVAVSARAGQPVWIPPDAAGHCCATPWSSKGYRRGHDHMAAKTAAALWRWSDAGALPVVIDASSCALGLLSEIGPRLPDAERERFEQIEVLDSIAWAHDRLLAGLAVTRKVATAAVHPTCSATQLGLAGKLQAIASELAEEVVVPNSSTCCGMAGDRGMLHPELPASAMRDAAAELSAMRIDEHVCSNRTCEIGLQQTTGAPYASFVLLLERLTRPTLAGPAHLPSA